MTMTDHERVKYHIDTVVDDIEREGSPDLIVFYSYRLDDDVAKGVPIDPTQYVERVDKNSTEEKYAGLLEPIRQAPPLPDGCVPIAHVVRDKGDYSVMLAVAAPRDPQGATESADGS
jgi:hypothetical protein